MAFESVGGVGAAAVTYCYWLYCFAALLIVLRVYYTYILQLCTFYIDVLSVCHDMMVAVRQKHSLPLYHCRYVVHI